MESETTEAEGSQDSEWSSCSKDTCECKVFDAFQGEVQTGPDAVKTTPMKHTWSSTQSSASITYTAGDEDEQHHHITCRKGEREHRHVNKLRADLSLKQHKHIKRAVRTTDQLWLHVFDWSGKCIQAPQISVLACLFSSAWRGENCVIVTEVCRKKYNICTMLLSNIYSVWDRPTHETN